MNDDELKRYLDFMAGKLERDIKTPPFEFVPVRRKSNRLADIAVYIGRFQPFHRGHLATLKLAFQVAENVVVGIGSAQESRTMKNPFTWQERVNMIRSTLSEEERNRLNFIYLYDNAASDEDWAKSVRDQTRQAVGYGEITCLVGVHKDASSRYLDWFPDWKYIEGPQTDLLNATDIRSLLASGVPKRIWSVGLPDSVADYIENNGLVSTLKDTL